MHKNGQHAGSINKNLALLVCKKTSRYRKAEEKKAAPSEQFMIFNI